MSGPIFRSAQRNPRSIDVELHRQKSGEIIGITIKTPDGREIHIQSKPFYQKFDKSSFQYLFQDLTSTIGRQTTAMQETLRPAPEAQRQAPAEPPPQRPQPAPSENIPRQAEQRAPSLPQETIQQQEANAPATPAGDGESSIAQPPKTDQKPSPLPSHSPTSSSAKGAPPPPGQELSGEKKSLMYQQVLLASRLFSSSERREGIAASRILFFAEQFRALAQDCEKLEVIVRQLAAQNQGISAEQGKQLNSVLQTFLKELQAAQKQAHEAMPQLQKAPADQALPKDLQQAFAMLKERCEKSASQMQNQLDLTLAKLAAEPPKSTLIPASPGSEKEALAKPGQKLAAEQESSPAQTAAASSEKGGARPAMVFTPSLPASESLAQGAAEARAISAKSSTQPPQILQSSADLQVFNDKLQKRELHAPLNISVLYPFNTKEQNASSASGKARSERGGKGEQSSQGGGAGGRAHSQEMVLIPAGPAFNEGSQIVELDAFLIAAFPVTNEQYADWLNESFAEGKIKLDEKGVIRDSHRNILYKTHWAAPTSQIETEVSQGQILFKPLKGTQRHPVVQVSWFGAMAYCNANSFRLPTEAEWEKAAGMSPDQSKKSRYGFGKDEIDLSWANYRDELKPYDDNRTSPVGFYNGETFFTKGGKNYQSHHAISPLGCYDMSGNARQWTDEEEKGLKVTKGGSYNTPPAELSVSSREIFSPETCLQDVGFRVALSL